MAIVDPKIHRVALEDGEHEISAKYAQVNNKDVEIAQLIDVGSDIAKLDSLPTASESTWNTYHQSIVLIPKSGGTGYDEYIISKGGTSTTPTYEWVDIGDTSVDLSGAAKAGTYTTTSAPINATGTGSVSGTVKYSKSNATTQNATDVGTADTNTGTAGGHTISGSNFTFSGTSITYQPAGTISAVSASSHSHAVNVASSSQKVITGVSGTFNTDAIKTAALASTTASSGIAVPVTLRTTADSAGGHTHTLNRDEATTFVVTSAIKSAALATTTANTGITVPVTLRTTADSAGGHTHEVDSHTHGTNVTASKINSYTAPSMTSIVFTKNTLQSLTTKNFGFNESKTKIMSTPTVSTDGVLSWSLLSASTQDALSAGAQASLTGGVFSAGTFTYTASVTAAAAPSAATLTSKSGGAHTHTLSGGSVGKMTVTTAAASTVSKQYVTGTATESAGAHTHSLSGGSVGKMTVTTTAAGTGSPSATSVTITYVTGATTGLAGAISAQPTFTGTTATLGVAGTIGGSQTVSAHSHTYTAPKAHAHGITLTTTNATISLSASVAIPAHTHDVTIDEL